MSVSREVALYSVAAMAGAVGLGAGIYFLGKRCLRQQEVSMRRGMELFEVHFMLTSPITTHPHENCGIG